MDGGKYRPTVRQHAMRQTYRIGHIRSFLVFASGAERLEINRAEIRKSVAANVFYEGHSSFDYNVYHKNAGWNQRRLVTATLSKCESLTFQCRVCILKQYDLNGYPVHDQVGHLDEESKMNDVLNVPKEHAELERKAKEVSEIAELKNEIESLNKKVAEMQRTIIDLQSKIGGTEQKEDMDDHWMSNAVIAQMINEMKREIEVLKQERNVDEELMVPGMEAKGGKMSEVEQWLKNVVNLHGCYPVFRENGFDDLRIVQMLSMQQLEKMGIAKVGHRLKIMSAVQSLKRQNGINTIMDSKEENKTEQLYYPTPNDAK